MIKYRGHIYPDNFPIKEKVVNFDTYLKFKDVLPGCKKNVKITCDFCNTESLVMWRDIARRVYFNDKQVCKKCVLKETTNLEQWKEKNSKAQLIAQNRPEVLYKQRFAQSKLMKEDKDYCNKRSSGNLLKGYYYDIYFESSYELFYIYHCIKNNVQIYRSDLEIEYINKYGFKTFYHPDFEIIRDDKKYIVEIKGYSGWIKEFKNKAAMDYIKNNNIYSDYLFYDENKLKSLNDYCYFSSTKRINEILDTDRLTIVQLPKKWENREGLLCNINLKK